MAKVKYTGTADRRIIPKGTNFGGQLADPTDKEVVFSHDNSFLVDTEEAGLSKEAVELLTKDDDFRDVSDLKTYPRSGAEKRRYGRGRDDAEAVSEEEESESSTPKKKGSSGGGSSPTAGTTTTGGSTAGGGTGS